MIALASPLSVQGGDGPPEATMDPIVRTVDLEITEEAMVTLSDGTAAHVRLIGIETRRDDAGLAIREASVRVEVNGETIDLPVANYNLPRTVAGVQIDATIVRDYLDEAHHNRWGLEKDARLRLWPEGSPWIEPGTFVYPVLQRWGADVTQGPNEPAYVGGTTIGDRVYYHNEVDFGGAEGLVPVVAATDGLVVSAVGETLPGYDETPVRARYDAVYILDDRGWYYRYSHLVGLDLRIRIGQRVEAGHPVGVIGKEGHSGGWSHLHFGATGPQPSGDWGIEEVYPFLWQAYHEQYDPAVIAWARPHRVAAVGKPVELDGSLSRSSSGSELEFEWTFTDGGTASGSRVTRTYDKPGTYSEILKVTDENGNVDYDFAYVRVMNPDKAEYRIPHLHASYHPSLGVRPGHEVTFMARIFSTSHGYETWDFGDGSPTVQTRSRDGQWRDPDVEMHARDGYASITHQYREPGHYIVRVERTNEHGEPAIAHLHVVVEE